MANRSIDPNNVVPHIGGYGGEEDGSYTVFDSRSPKWNSNKQDLGTSEGAMKSANVLNSLRHDSAVVKEQMGIWRGVTKAYGFNNYGQHAIEGLKKLQDLPDGSHVIIYDFETLGNSPMDIAKGKGGTDFYTPTEIGLRKAVKRNGELHMLDDKLSVLVKPVPHVATKLKGLLNNVEGSQWIGMHPDVARTLSDLTLYAGNKQPLFDKNGNLVSVKNQNRAALPLKNTVISSASNIGLMKSGLNNLLEGTPPQEMAAQLNAFMSGTVNPMFMAFNNYNFDQPLGMDFFGSQLMQQLDGDTTSQKYLADFLNAFGGHQVDLLHAERTIQRNLHQRNGNSNTLESQSERHGFTQEVAHHALSDAGATMQKGNQLLKDTSISNYLVTGGKKGTMMGRFNAKELEVGDRLFAHSGMSSSQAGAFDGVFTVNRKGVYAPVNNIKPNPIYKGSTYEITRFLDGVKVDGKTQYGVELFNYDDELHHVIYRDSKADLQEAIHGHLDYIDKVDMKHTNTLVAVNRDRGLRRWNKMFSTESGGGENLVNRMLDALDTKRRVESNFSGHTDVGNIMATMGVSKKEAEKIVAVNKARVAKIVDRAISRQSEWNTDAFVRDFHTIHDRLVGEEDWIRGFQQHLDKSPLAGNSAFAHRARNMAWSEFGNMMSSHFGPNESGQYLGKGVIGLNLKVDGKENLLRINDVDSMRGSIRNMLHQDHAGNASLPKMRSRFRQLIGELKTKNALEAKQYEYFYKEFDKIGWDPKNGNYPIENLLNDLSNAVLEARERNYKALNGALQTINIEDPTRVVTGARKKRLAEDHAAMAPQMYSEIVRRVTPFTTHWDTKSKSPLPIHGGKALDVIAAHKEGIENMLNRTSITNNIALDLSNLRNPNHGIENVARAYMKQKMHVKIVYDGKRDAMSMVLADQSTPSSALDGSLKDIMGGRYKNDVAVIHLPKITKDGQVSLGGQNRVARFIATSKNGGYGIQTSYDEILGTIAGNAKYARNILDEARGNKERSGVLQMESRLNSRAKKAMQNLSLNNRNINPRDREKMYEIRSNAANWARGGAIDLSAVADDWYEDFYLNTSKDRRKLWRMKTPDEVREMARDNNELFVNSLDSNSRRIFQRQVDSYWNERTGMNVGMHSIKDTHVSNYLRAGVDIRELYGFGYDNPMARENMQKTVNYLALDKAKSISQLRNQRDEVTGKRIYSNDDIRRMVSMGLTTDRAKEVFEDYQGDGKMSFMNMRTAYMDDATLKARVQTAKDTFEAKAAEARQKGDAAGAAKYEAYAAALNNPEAISVYDGMFLMSKEASSAFETTRTKKIKIHADAQLSREMQVMLNTHVDAKFDLGKDYEFKGEEMPKLSTILAYAKMKNKNASGTTLTVSQIVQHDLQYETDADGNPIDVLKKDENGNFIRKRKVMTDAVYDKWYMKDARIKSYNAEERTFEIEETIRSMKGTKYNTTSGGRLTGNNNYEQEIIEEIAGMKGVQAIMPSMEPSKKLWGTVLNEYTSLAIDEVKRQTASGKLTVGGLSRQEALEGIRNGIVNNFGLKDKDVKVMNGHIQLDRNVRVGDDHLDIRNIHGFIQGTRGILGDDFSDQMNGQMVQATGHAIRYANVGVGKADVYDWENGIGFIDGSHKGLVTYGWKEVDMVTSRANQILGKGNAVTGWLGAHIESVAGKQNEGIDQIGSGLYRVTTDQRDFVPDKGDVIIKTTGPSFGVDDPLGRSTGRITDKGVHEISMHAMNPLPKVTARDTLPTAEEYAGTILDFARAKGHFEDGKSFEDVIKANNGTALLEMPETGPGSGFIRDHVRLVDWGDVTRGGTSHNPILREIQKTQQQLWRQIRSYQDLGNNDEMDDKSKLERAQELKENINKTIVQYEEQAAHMFTNARDGGYHKMLSSADMDMAGRFRIQGVNPMANYTQDASGRWKQTGKYKEGHIYMSRQRLREMIMDGDGRKATKAMNILEAMHESTKGTKNGFTDKEWKHIQSLDLVKDNHKIVNKVLDNVNSKGLYGLVNRYPTIKQSTIQSMRYMIDDEMTRTNDRTAKLTVGTAQRLKADYDGDFMSALLTHYGTDSAIDVHEGLRKMNIMERHDARKAGVSAVADIMNDASNVAKTYNTTVSDIVQQFDLARDLHSRGELDKEENKKFKAIYSAFTIKNRKTAEDALETQEARLGKEMVGFVDNTRFKVDTYMGYVTDLIQRHEHEKLDNQFKMGNITKQEFDEGFSRIAREQESNRNIVQKVMAAFSQDSISAKKFDYDKAKERIAANNPSYSAEELTHATNEDITNRYLKLLDMDAYVKNLTPENKQNFIEANKVVGIYEGDEGIADMHKALDTLEQYQKYGAKVGGVRNMSFKIPVSEGLNAEQTRTFANGTGAYMFGTEGVMNIINSAPNKEIKDRLLQQVNRTNKRITQAYNDISNGADESLEDSLGGRGGFDPADYSLSGSTVGEKKMGGLLDTISRYAPKLKAGEGAMAGGLAFGAMWAASALIRSGPTPEGLQQQTKNPAPGPAAPPMDTNPTARITKNNGEYVNIQVNAKNAKNMSEQDIAALVHQELGAMTNVKLNTNLNVNDNTQNIDPNWLQGVVAKAINGSYAF